jgi:hypothetical protein
MGCQGKAPAINAQPDVSIPSEVPSIILIRKHDGMINGKQLERFP